ncbi:Calcium-binding protein NCS-1 [Mycoemilia scoparia]|uniref:Calcium-binding protein NCS-1 n=1 Tax=Mycoemilia scoparia TaxID=417184 RepID=A0A9W8ACQ4_9FUNG|nr:Calcium-binding protein NCS-1 [Mycoemilia scoparia]
MFIFEILTECKHSIVKKREIKKLYKSFIFEFPDGQIKPVDFRQIYKKYFISGSSLEFADHIFDLFDQNQDGYIDFTELIQGLSVTDRETPENKLRWLFNIYDTDHDGMISKAEMYKVVQSLLIMVGSMVKQKEQNYIKEAVETMFSVIDKDQNELLSFDEFKKHCLNDTSTIRVLDTSHSFE